MTGVYTVSQINAYIRSIFVRDFALSNICIAGEVSNCKYHTAGHIYFTLKDDGAAISCVMFASNRSGLSFRIMDGQKLEVRGQVSVYEKNGTYQLYARSARLSGQGELYERFLMLKEELKEMGMFDEMYKKPIPAYAESIGIVTSPTGAAIQDICNIAGRRNPYTRLILYPALVQGEGAKEDICRGIRKLDAMGLDVIIVGRGGGSIEDLWAFNEEDVARAIFDADTPIVSAVGHETDFTIADFVADKRAPTPSAAAELCTFRYEDLERELSAGRDRLDSAIQRKLEGKRRALYNRRLRLLPHDPASVLKERRLRLRQLESGYEKALRLRLRDAKARKEAFAFDIYSAIRSKMTASRHGLELRAGRLDASSPLRRISGGYGYITGEDGKAIRSIREVQEGGTVRTRLRDGSFISTVNTVERPGRKINSKAERSYEKGKG